MYIYGQLLKAQLENTSADLSPASTGLVYFNTSTAFIKYYNGSAWKTLVDTNSAQIITQKQLGTLNGSDLVIACLDTNLFIYDSTGTARVIRFDAVMPADNTSVKYAASQAITSGIQNNLTIVDTTTAQAISGKTSVQAQSFQASIAVSVLNGGPIGLANPTNTAAFGYAASPSMVSDVFLYLPTTAGTAGQVLTTPGTYGGQLSWTTVSGSGNVGGEDYTWATADGTSKVVTHTLNSVKMDVTIIDLSDNQIIQVDTITINSTSQVTLTASEAPSGSSWRVVLQAKA